MIASFAFVWGVFSVILILAGILDGFTGWLQMFPARVLLLVFLFLLVLIWMLYSMSLIISDLTMKNQELAMQVSLLNNENEKILKRVKKLTESENLRKQGRKI
jgi:Na+-transporting methylmalonyl-CoA/oxaloacetate decarboxylase gamma subunit